MCWLERCRHWALKKRDLSLAQALLNTNPKRPKELVTKGLPVSRDGGAKTPADLLALEGVRLVDCKRLWPELEDMTPNCTVNLRQIAVILVISRVSRQILRPCGVMMP